MKTMVFGKNSAQIAVQCKMQEIPKLPRRSKGSAVLVKVHAVGLNPVDAKLVVGDKIPSTWKRTRALFHSAIVQDTAIGFDFAGTVVDNGLPNDDDDDDNNVTTYRVGDEVYGTVPPLYGSLREYLVAPLHQISAKPKSLSFAQAAALPLVGLTAYQALYPYRATTANNDKNDDNASLQNNNNKSIVVVGASGGTGHVALQVAERMGFTTRIAICSQRNFDWVRQDCKPTHFVDYRNNDNMVQEIQSIVGAEGSDSVEQSGQVQVNVVMDCVTSEDSRDQQVQYPSLFLPLVKERYIRLGGGFTDWVRAGIERKTYLSCFGKEKLFWIRFPNSSDALKQLQEWADDNNKDDNKPPIQPKIAQVVTDFTAEAVQKAMEDLLARRVAGKIVVQLVQEDTPTTEQQTEYN